MTSAAEHSASGNFYELGLGFSRTKQRKLLKFEPKLLKFKAIVVFFYSIDMIRCPTDQQNIMFPILGTVFKLVITSLLTSHKRVVKLKSLMLVCPNRQLLTQPLKVETIESGFNVTTLVTISDLKNLYLPTCEQMRVIKKHN